jgi:hypothetical protein
MAHGQFQVSDTNPNDVTGGGGCICDQERQVDCQPPFAVFPGNEMDSLASPHVVVCRRCYELIGEAFQGEILSAGEKSPVEITLGPGDFEDLEDLRI